MMSLMLRLGIMISAVLIQSYVLLSNWQGTEIAYIQVSLMIWNLLPAALFGWLTRKNGQPGNNGKYSSLLQISAIGIPSLLLHAFILGDLLRATSSTAGLIWIVAPVYEVVLTLLGFAAVKLRIRRRVAA